MGDVGIPFEVSFDLEDSVCFVQYPKLLFAVEPLKLVFGLDIGGHNFRENEWIEEQSDAIDDYDDVDTKIYGY